MTVFPYIVVMAATHPRSGETVEHTVAVEAYNLNEAMMQALFELDAKHDYNDQQYKLKVVAIRPDTERARAQVEDMLRDLQLLRLPSQGGGQS